MDNLVNEKDVILQLEGVGKTYGELKALDGINLTVKRGQWLAIMGPSGSGKSTLMNIIGCMDKADSGKVYLDGQDLSLLSPKELTALRRDKVGLVFQQFHLVSYLTALENVMLAQYYHSIPDKAEALEALEQVGLADRASHLPRQLSGGEQQRVCIARALINQPALLLADEPTGNLDEKNEQIVLQLFKKLHKLGTTIIVVTHDNTVGAMAKTKIVLQHGVIAEMHEQAVAAELVEVESSLKKTNFEVANFETEIATGIKFAGTRPIAAETVFYGEKVLVEHPAAVEKKSTACTGLQAPYLNVQKTHSRLQTEHSASQTAAENPAVAAWLAAKAAYLIEQDKEG